MPNDYDDLYGLQEIEEDGLIVPVTEQFETDTVLKEEALAIKGSTKFGDGTVPGRTGDMTPGGRGTANMSPTRERTKTVSDGSGSPER